MSSDPKTPNLARMYDYMLGGKDNHAIDREAVDRLVAHVPETVPLARAARAFLGRAVRHLAADGVRQFLDLGSGLPTQGHVHEVVRDVAPAARVVYVDRDPAVADQARALLGEPGRVAFVEADLLRPAELLARPEVAGLIDLAEPVGVLLVSVLHVFPDADDPQGVVATLREAVAPGSHLVLTHAVAAGTSRGSAACRTPPEIRAFFGDFELLKPGLVQVAEWRPDDLARVWDAPLPPSLLAGVARKPPG
ncbi:MAG TPA: SAM-dependent methyltransferase [Nonomuraea sp.]|nr:SAM-dependent methyltransferase [Nonomuraea sp.]